MELALHREERAEARRCDTSSEEESLVQAARDGDRAAFARLHERYFRVVHGIVLARVPRSEAGDLVQEVFLMALRKLHTLRDSAAFGPWLTTIARNRANDFHRRARPLAELREEPLQRSRAEDDVEVAQVLQVLGTLPGAYRETLILRLVEGLNGPEIAERTGRTPASVRVNLHRGMRLLRGRLRGGQVDG
jgi:RNA polymerase sigma-70 factor, ECF subfamily